MTKRSLRSPPTATPDLSGWLVPAGVAVIGATYGLARYGYGLTLPEFRAAFGLSTAAAGGIASGSLHGWLWLVAAFAGNIAGTRLRPMFDLPVERTRTAC